MDSVGDLARALVLRTNQVRLRQEMDVLATEVATGFVKDTAKHLKGDTSGLLAIDRSLARLDAFRLNNAEATLISGSMQTALDEIQSRTQQVSEILIAAELTPNDSLLNTMSTDAQDAFAQVLGAMNRSVAGRFLFSGVATDRTAVPEIDAMMTALRKHEAKHHKIFEDEAKAFKKAMAREDPFPKEEVDGRMYDFYSAGQDKQDAYDSKTNHGEKEGVVLP